MTSDNGNGNGNGLGLEWGAIMVAMCLLAIALRALPSLEVVVAANRDESHRRPTAAAEFWSESQSILAGRDLEGGGTWLGLTRDGRVAAVTNFREPGRAIPGAPSRGRLVSDFLLGGASAKDYAAEVHARGSICNGFNLVVGNRGGWWYCSNRGRPPQPIAPGIHGLSNHFLDTPWPKVVRVRDRLASLGGCPEPIDIDQVLAILDDRRQAAEAELPETGVGPEWERALSAPFIVTPEYGTRSSTVILIDSSARVRFCEQSFAADGTPCSRRDFSFSLDPLPSGGRW